MPPPLESHLVKDCFTVMAANEDDILCRVAAVCQRLVAVVCVIVARQQATISNLHLIVPEKRVG